VGALLVGSFEALAPVHSGPAFIAAVIGGSVGGLVAAMFYSRFTVSVPGQAEDERAAAGVGPARWPMPALVRLLIGSGLPLLVAAIPLFPGSLWLPYILPVLIGSGWAMSFADGFRTNAYRPPWTSVRRLALALGGAGILVLLLTGLSATTMVLLGGSAVEPPVVIESTLLLGRGWPNWSEAWVDRVDVDRTREYRPQAHRDNAALWTAIVALSLLIEPVVGSAVRWRRRRG
jgi:MFS family permease